MRPTLTIATLTIACIVVLAASARAGQAQDSLGRCRQINDDAQRLKCYDALDTSSPEAVPGQAGGRGRSDGAWEVRDEKSPLDDSPVVTASVRSSDDKALLLMRCKDRKTEVAINKFGFVKCGADVRVIYRIDQEQVVETPWQSHSSCVLAIAPSAVPFIRALRDDGKVYFRMFDHHGAAHEALFNLGKVSEVRSRLAEACNWEGGR
jgi:hypothetical protein